ncbi:MAG: hypothetical protein CMM07_07600 [Rhodopirellula sp.]|nr:hypothetical protein [Rhodopirellula sp.]
MQREKVGLEISFCLASQQYRPARRMWDLDSGLISLGSFCALKCVAAKSRARPYVFFLDAGHVVAILSWVE